MNSSILQSIVQVNSDNIKRHQAFYISYKDILKDFRQCGKSDDEAYVRYSKAAQKELNKLHLLERNQRALLAELKDTYAEEDFERILNEYEEGLSYA